MNNSTINMYTENRGSIKKYIWIAVYIKASFYYNFELNLTLFKTICFETFRNDNLIVVQNSMNFPTTISKKM